ncbi:MAG: ferric reductase-like transmembrane domain-containing protein, partial [Anaerolineae bacterium]|nr:ferric reductase-like transmembrane domain-containing protein [Anaerolineae bacterium]
MQRKQFWLRAALHVAALGALIYVLMGAAGPQWELTNRHDRVLEAGVWAVRFLLFSLAISPLNTYLGWRSAIPLRKLAGLWAFGFGVLHFALSLSESQPFGAYLLPPVASFVIFGLIALVILAALAATSTRWAQRRLGKNWKRLHRLVYVAGL